MKISFRFVTALGLGAVLSLSSVTAPTASAQGGGRANAGRPAGGARGMERMAQMLGLNASQKSKIMAIITAQRPQMQAVAGNKSLTQQQKMTKMRAMNEAGMKKVNAILTPAQRQKLAAIVERMRGQMQRPR